MTTFTFDKISENKTIKQLVDEAYEQGKNAGREITLKALKMAINSRHRDTEALKYLRGAGFKL